MSALCVPLHAIQLDMLLHTSNGSLMVRNPNGDPLWGGGSLDDSSRACLGCLGWVAASKQLDVLGQLCCHHWCSPPHPSPWRTSPPPPPAPQDLEEENKTLISSPILGDTPVARLTREADFPRSSFGAGGCQQLVRIFRAL